MKDMENHFFKKSKTRYLTPSLFSHGLFTAPHRDPRAPRQCHWQATTEGRTGGHTGGAEGAAMHYALLLPFTFPKVLAKEQEGGEQQRCAQNEKQIKTRKPNQNNTASEAQALHERRIRSKLGSKRQR